MTAKRDKPALFELVNRGPLKPNNRGELQTPGWFFSNKTVVVKPNDQESVAQVTLGNEVKKSQGWLSRFRRPQQAQKETHVPPVTKQAETAPPTRPPGKLFRLAMPYWVLPLTALGLFFIIVVSYQFGQTSGIKAAQAKLLKMEAVEPPGQSLEKVRQGPVREGLLPPPAPPVAAQVTAPTVATPAVSPPTAEAMVAPKDGNHLVFCGHSDPQELSDVQEFFAANGITCKVGRMNGRHVLYSTQGFVNTKDSDATALQNRVADIGKRYNSEKPKGAARFNPETFVSAFWAKAGNIE